MYPLLRCTPMYTCPMHAHPHAPCHGPSWMDCGGIWVDPWLESPTQGQCRRAAGHLGQQCWTTVAGDNGRQGCRPEHFSKLLAPLGGSMSSGWLSSPHSASRQSIFFFFFQEWRCIYRHSNFKSPPCTEMTLIFSRSLLLRISITLYNP